MEKNAEDKENFIQNMGHMFSLQLSLQSKVTKTGVFVLMGDVGGISRKERTKIFPGAVEHESRTKGIEKGFQASGGCVKLS